MRQMPREWIVSAETFTAETAKIFSSHWLCVAHQSEFPAAPSVRRFRIADFEIAICRSSDNDWSAMHNLCRHRGAIVCQDECTSLTTSTLVCKYHAWKYDLTGSLIAAPHTDPQVEPGQTWGLRPIQLATWAGFIFVNLADSANFDRDYQPLVARLQNWQPARLAVRHKLHYEVECNWKLLFQNYSECYHCPHVHPELNQVTPYRSAQNDLETGPFLGGPMGLADGVETISDHGKLAAPRLPQLAPQQRRQVYYYTAFPTMFMSAHPDYVMVHVLHRRTPTRTDIDCYFLAQPASEAYDAGEDQPDIAAAVRFWDRVNQQDWQICEATQQGINSPAYEPGPYTELESMVAAFDHHYRQVMIG